MNFFKNKRVINSKMYNGKRDKCRFFEEVRCRQDDHEGIENVWYVLAWRLHLITKKPSKGNREL